MMGKFVKSNTDYNKVTRDCHCKASNNMSNGILLVVLWIQLLDKWYTPDTDKPDSESPK